MIRKPGWRPDNTAFVTPSGEVIRVKGSNDASTVILDNHATRQQGGSLPGQKETWDFAFRHGGDHHFLGCLRRRRRCDRSITRLTGVDSRGRIYRQKFARQKHGLERAPSRFWLAKAFEERRVDRADFSHSLRATDSSVEYLAERSTGTFLGSRRDQALQGP